MVDEVEKDLLQRSLSAIDDTPLLKVARKLKDRRDQGITLVERSLLAGFSDELKAKLIDWALAETSGSADAAVGAMMGLVVGDWVGAPLEFLPAEDEPSESCWSHEDFECKNPNLKEIERGVLKHGQWTDDSSMALCLADSLIVRLGIDGSDLRLRFWNWHAEAYNCTFRFDPDGSTNIPTKPPRASFGLGYNIAKSIIAMEPDQEITPQFINPGSSDSGNGGLMRLAPVPVFFASRSVEETMDAAAASSLATHPGALATESARCLAFIVHRAINLPADVRKGGASSFLLAVCDEYAKIVAERIAALEAKDSDEAREEKAALAELQMLLLSTKPADGTEACWNWRTSPLPVLDTLKARGEKYNGFPVSRPYFGSYCMDGLAIALYSVSVTTSFHHAIERAANFLGDADTVAAIAGQIAGAFYGLRAIDSRYLVPIQQWDRNEITCRAIMCFMLGRSILEQGTGPAWFPTK